MRQWHGTLKNIMYIYQSRSLLCTSSSFLLSTILIRSTIWIRWRLGICGLKAHVHFHQPPCSQDCEKLGGSQGMRLCNLTSLVDSWAWDYHLTGEWNMNELLVSKKPKYSYAGLMKSVRYSIQLVSKHSLKAIRGYGRLGTRIDLQYKIPLIFHPYNQL